MNGIRAFYLKSKEAPCVDCGNSFPSECMDFDHRPGEIKLFVPNRIPNLEALKVELTKCDLVCANCHRIRTKRRGVSEETKRRISSALKGKPLSRIPEQSVATRMKRSESLKAFHIRRRNDQ